MKRRSTSAEYVVCVGNKRYKASLVIRRIYLLLPDPEAKKRGLLRVVDESGEDYLFPRDLFEAIDLSRAVERKLALANS